ncbi:MAG: DNA repair protein RadC [Spirochaetales bacterium]
MKLSLYERPNDRLQPREKFQVIGPSGLSDQELLQLILGTGTKASPVAQLANRVLQLLDRWGPSLDLSLLDTLEGIGPARKAQLAAVLELVRRLGRPPALRIVTPSDLYPRLLHFADRPQEVFLAATLNGAHELLALHTVTIGLLNRTLVHPREVFAPALNDRAASVVLAHSHPSGNHEPSLEDREATSRLCRAGKLLGIEVLDHLIFSAAGYLSFREKGLLFL